MRLVAPITTIPQTIMMMPMMPPVVSYSGAIREMSVVIGAFLGWQFLGESMGGMRVLGSIIIFSGILTIAIFG